MNVDVSPDETWQHEWTGLAIPPTYRGYIRTGVKQYAEDDMNVSIQLWDGNGETSITIYVYRTASPNISIWGDRALTAMISNANLGNPVDGEVIIGQFSPLNDSGSESAFHAVAKMEGGNVNATGVSLFAHNDWIIKVRASSEVLSAEEITQAIGNIISGMELGTSGTTYPGVEFIADCEDGLDFANQVKIQQFDLVGQLIFSSTADRFSVTESGQSRDGRTWCRDPQSSVEVGIYRSDASDNSYFAALGDSGVGALVSRLRTSSQLLSLNGYVVQTSDGLYERLWPFFNKMPHPMILANNYDDIAPLSTVDVRPGSDGQQTIIVDPASIPEK
ncbi:MAG: hypothetical protein AAFY07_13300 [Pseudomonadota bacterium]